MDDRKVIIFEKQLNVVIEEKGPSKIVLRNTETGNKTSFIEKTDIAIISLFKVNAHSASSYDLVNRKITFFLLTTPAPF